MLVGIITQQSVQSAEGNNLLMNAVIFFRVCFHHLTDRLKKMFGTVCG